VRGEVITHSSGMVFEIMEADPRRVSSLKISHIPEENEAVEE
jgi:Mg2+/Co2+ transporter CorC